MSVIKYGELESAIDPIKDKASSPVTAAAVVLIHGEELLVKSALNRLIAFLVPADARSVSYEPVDAAVGNLHEAVAKVSTYPLLGDRRVVELMDARLFESRNVPAQILRKSKDAIDSKRLQRAAVHLLDFMALTGIDLEDLTGSGREEHLPQDPELVGDGRWLDEIIAFCRQTGRTAAAAADTEGLLEKTIERGIPTGNCLILTTESVDRRKKLYDLIKQKGLVIDCSVPTGVRKADKKAQEAVLQEIAGSLLQKNEKKMDPGVFELLVEMTGFEPRTFTGNLEKLITYTGRRSEITRSDVKAVLERTKQDPVFAFTSAVTDRNAADALFYLDSLLHDPQQPMRPEQIIVAILNQVRKLLRIKEFIATPEGSVWFAGCPFGQFKTTVMPAVQAHDQQLMNRIGEWRDELTASAKSGGQSRADGKKFVGKAGSDLSIAPQPKNPYPVYQLFRKSERFNLESLLQAVEHLARADRQIKSGTDNKQLILERLVWSVCGGENASDKDRLYHRTGQ